MDHRLSSSAVQAFVFGSFLPEMHRVQCRVVVCSIARGVSYSSMSSHGPMSLEHVELLQANAFRGFTGHVLQRQCSCAVEGLDAARIAAWGHVAATHSVAVSHSL